MTLFLRCVGGLLVASPFLVMVAATIHEHGWLYFVTVLAVLLVMLGVFALGLWLLLRQPEEESK